MLLCFDNFEHVLEGASFVGDILKEAQKVKLLVTSREPLRITGEQLYPLEPLMVEGPVQADRWDLDAVRLFADRASLVDLAFTLNVNSIAGVHSICQRLDGIPLAIELAAAWMDNFSLEELLAELDQQLELTARLIDLPERHRSLRASLEWSWNLLDEDHRNMLLAISTFRGGCFRDAASAVLQMKGMKLRRGLARLIDKSWLYTRDVDGQTRFYLRDAASREFTFKKLEETKEANACPTMEISLYETSVMAHAKFFSELMECQAPKLHGHGQQDALQLIGLETQNIYEAWDTLLHRLESSSLEPPTLNPTPILLLPIVRWLWEFFDMISDYSELEERYTVLKDAAGQADGQQQILFWALLGCGRGHWRLGNFDRAHRETKEAQALAEVLGDRYAQALSLSNLGIVEWNQGNYDEARTFCNESLEIKRKIGDQRGIAVSLNILGLVERAQGNNEIAHELYAESLEIKRGMGDYHGIAEALNNIGVLAYFQGNYDMALKIHAESLAIKREIGNRTGIAASLNNLGLVEYSQGNYNAALELYASSLAIDRELGDRSGISGSLSNMGMVEHVRGNYETARELHIESLAIDREIGDRDGQAASLANQGLAERILGHYSTARELYAESMDIYRQTRNGRGICDIMVAIGGLLVTTASNPSAPRSKQTPPTYPVEASPDRTVGAICLLGARYHAAQIGSTFEPMESDLLEEGLAAIEHPETGLPPAERERLKAQAESMSLDELVECAMDVLDKLALVQRASDPAGHVH